jgi:hypothetical protein
MDDYRFEAFAPERGLVEGGGRDVIVGDQDDGPFIQVRRTLPMPGID